MVLFGSSYACGGGGGCWYIAEHENLIFICTNFDLFSEISIFLVIFRKGGHLMSHDVITSDFHQNLGK